MSAQDQATLLMLKGVIHDLPPLDRQKFDSALEKVRAAVAEHDDFGALALVFVAAEFAAAEQD